MKETVKAAGTVIPVTQTRYLDRYDRTLS